MKKAIHFFTKFFVCFLLFTGAQAQTTLVQWNFNSVPPDGNTGTGSTNPSMGTGTISLVGTSASFASGTAGNGSSDPATSDNTGYNTAGYAPQGTENKGRGIQFQLATTGFQNIVVSWDQRFSNTASGRARLQYSVDGGNTFIDTDGVLFVPVGDTWYNENSFDLSGITALNNQTDVRFRIVSEFAPGTSSYAAATTSSSYGTTGTWRFDMLTVRGTSQTGPLGDTPTITENSITPFINLPDNTSGVLSGVIDNPTDPGRTIGIDFTIADTDTPVENLIVTVSSDNASVVADGDLLLTGSDASRNLKINPTGVGYSTITVSVSDGSSSATYLVNYAASASSTSTSRFHSGASDASTAVGIDGSYMLVGDDEGQALRLYDRTNSGLPVNSFDYTASLGLTQASGGVPREVDIEASLRADNHIYWFGSQSNNDGGTSRPNRNRVFATDLAGSGASASLSYVGRYDFLKDDIIAWDVNDGHGKGANFYGLQASAASGVGSKQPDGYNIEGAELAPDNSTVYIAFRAPQVTPANRTKALIVPVKNLTSLISNATAGSATFGESIELDLGGRGIREIRKNAANQYLIVAGPAGDFGPEPNDFRLYRWTGNASDAPMLLPADLGDLGGSASSIESIVELPADLGASGSVQFLTDNGDAVYYNDGKIAKDLSENNFKKFRSDIVSLGATATATVVINEIDSDTPGTDAAEFIELYDGGVGNTDLSGLVVVLFNGSNDLSYAAFDLDGKTTNAGGYFVLGNAGVTGAGLTFSNNFLQNGADAVALYRADASDFPNNTAVTTTNLLDVIVYDTNDADDTGLIDVLTPGQAQINEDMNNDKDNHSLQRIPNGSGGLRNTTAYQALEPTPNAANGLVARLSVNDVTLSEGNSGTTDFTFTVSLSAPAPAGGVTFDIATADNTATSPEDYTSKSLTGQTIPAGSSSYTFTVLVNGDQMAESNETFFVNVTNVTGAPVADGQGVGTIESDDVSVSYIHTIQGAGATTPVPNTSVAIEGIVTRTFVGSTKLNGFYVQEEDADADADPATSEGIFIFDQNAVFNGNPGDKVQVTGVVSEFTSSASGNSSSLTEITLTNAASINTVSINNPLPTVTTVQLPVANVGDLERYEGMLVEVSANEGNLAVTEYFQLGRFGQVVLSATGPSNIAGTDARLDQYTQFNAPSVPGYADYLAETAKRKIILDDGSSSSNPDPIIFGRGGQPLSATNTLRGGDEVASITAILDERFEGYRLQTTTGVNFMATNERPANPPAVGGTLKVGSFNLLNYFNGNGQGGGFPTSRGADNLTEFNRQRDKTIKAIVESGVDVFAFNELENDGYDANSAIQDIVNGINAATAPGTFAFINPGTSTATDEITVAMIYKPARVTPVGAAAVIPGSFGNGAFDIVGRKPLAQTFKEKATNAEFTVVANHWKSKGSSAGGAGDTDANDGQGSSSGTRTRQAQDLAAWIATNPTGTTDPDYLILGDLNAYAKEDPLTTLENAGYVNLVPNTTYSYVFNGFFGALDHALGSTSLVPQVTGATKWHINADEPPVLDYNTEFKSPGQVSSLYNPDQFRTSDHDPVIVGLSLTSPLMLTLNATNVLCNGAATGSIDLMVSGGKPGYTYAWSNGASNEDLSGLTAGKYVVTITDEAGQTAKDSVNITQPTAIAVTPGPDKSVVLGFGSNCTDISASATGGTGSLAYLWQPGNLAGQTVQVCPTATTTYIVTVTDENGCTAKGSVKVTVKDVRCGPGNQNVTICYYGVTQCVTEKIAERLLKVGATLGSCGTGSARLGAEEAAAEKTLTLSVLAFPNPTTGTVTVRIQNPASGPALLDVLDLAGRPQQQRVENLTEGANEIQFDLSRQASGTYLIRCRDALGRQAVVRVHRQ